MMGQYDTSFTHGAAWWAVYVACAATMTVVLMATFLVMANRAYREGRAHRD
jgi:hypothetical protein